MEMSTEMNDRAWDRGERDARTDLENGAEHRSTWGTDWTAMNGAYHDGYAHRWAAGTPA